ncbi:hypothetical protein [Knoellia aerolata]|uniref:hypothetical protein n=1 Tax=Knoellia aerolata TaxID=442954 RepID=UPI000ABAAC40|nr:hypothetical protein [Knoellia aerolata]
MTYLPAYVAATAGVVVALDAAYALLKYATTGHAPRPYSALTDRYEAWRDAQLPRPEPVPPQELADRLRRLSAEVQAVTASSRPAKALHLRAALLAYDDGLLQACRELHVQPPEGTKSGMSSQQRFQTESALMASGLVW